jgi:hypothetical protein
MHPSGYLALAAAAILVASFVASVLHGVAVVLAANGL